MSAEQIPQIRQLDRKHVEQARAGSLVAASVWDTLLKVTSLKFLFYIRSVINDEERKPQDLQDLSLQERVSQHLRQSTQSARLAEQGTSANNQTECWGVLSKSSTLQATLAKVIRKAPNAERIPIKYADGTLDTVYKINLKPGLELTMNENPLEERPDTVHITYRRQHTFADGCSIPITDVISLSPDGSFVVKMDYHPGDVKTQSFGGSFNEYRLNSQSLDTDSNLNPDLRAVGRGIKIIVGWCFTELDVNRSSYYHERM